MSSRPQNVFDAIVILWLLAWSVLVLSIDVQGLKQIVQAMRTSSFPSVPGKLVSHDLEPQQSKEGSRPDEDLSRWRLSVKYQYEVGGRHFEGDRISFWNPTGSGSLSQLEAQQERLLAKETVDVFYDPQDESNSMLDRRPGGGPLFLALLLTPFNLVMIGGWAWWKRRQSGLIGRLIHADGSKWIVRRAYGDPILTGVIVALLISVVGILIVGRSGWPEDLLSLQILWGILFAASAFVIWHAWRTRFSEPVRLVCDDRARAAIWPVDAGEASMPVDQWRRTELDERFSESANEQDDSYVVRLIFANSTSGEVIYDVLTTNIGWEAAALMEWLDDWFRSRQTQLGATQSAEVVAT